MPRESHARAALAGLLGVLLLAWGGLASAAPRAPLDRSRSVALAAEAQAPGFHDKSPPLTLIRPVARHAEREEHDVMPVPRQATGNTWDPVRQFAAPAAPTLPNPASFDGIGEEFTGPAGPFAVDAAPPDTNGDIGPRHYVQVVNLDFAVFSKEGKTVYGPVPLNTLWSGFAPGAQENACEADNDGDGVVLYDAQADRWFITQFAVSNPNPSYFQCVAVSVTGDPTGAYYRYAFSYNHFNDYGKFGIWPDGYYATYNMFGDSTALGAKVCAFDRVRMLAGQPATQQCVQLPSLYGGLLPADLDGHHPPPASAPGLIMGVSNNQLLLWRYTLDWSTPANSRLTGPVALAVAPFVDPSAIHQPGTEQRLNLLDDRLMYRLAYRNLGDHEALLVNHTVGAGAASGVRWYEVRDPGGTPSLFQQGTFAPDDGNYRWMGSIAMDQVGNIALGYSLSGGAVYPSIAITGRLRDDALNTLPQGERVLISGGGSQQADLDRWGDYSSLSVDPSDDCTFWYTNEYIAANGTFNWRTRIGSFRFPNCPPHDFTVTAPGPQTVPPGGSVAATVTTAATQGTPESLTLSVDHLPPGVTGTFAPGAVAAGGSATLTLTARPTGAVTTNAPYRILAVSPSTSHAVDATLTVPGKDFTLALEPAAPVITEGKSAVVMVKTQSLSGAGEPVQLELGALPPGVTGQLSTSTLAAGQTATLTLSVALDTAPSRPMPLVVTGTTDSASHPAEGSITTLKLPQTLISNPGDQSTVTSLVDIRVRASISPGTNLDRVEVYLDDALLGQPLKTLRDVVPWDTRKGKNGAHTLQSRVFDLAGNEARSPLLGVTVTNAIPRPAVAINTPADGDTLKGQVTITATATADARSSLTGIELYVDDARVGDAAAASPASFTWDSTGVKDGTHALSVRALDADGDVGSAVLNVTVRNTACGCGATANGSGILGLLLGLAALAWRSSPPRRKR